MLRQRLRPVQDLQARALPLQVPLVLLRQVQALHDARGPVCVQIATWRTLIQSNGDENRGEEQEN